MCGLVAILNRTAAVSASLLQAGLRALIHRGPDGEGIFFSHDERIALGHRRLSIIDIAGGQQPLKNEDDSVVAIINGEFYGYREIRKQLVAKGHCFRTESDSEILVHLYEENGIGCLNHLRGEFAFVLWDNKTGKIFAARDRFGIKPLLYADDGNQLILASEAKGILACGWHRGWDRESLYYALSMQYQLPDRTLFDGIRQVRPGHYLEWGRDTPKREIRYWDLNYQPQENLPRISEKEAIEEFRNRLDEAAALRLQGDVPVCAHLSGGIDSSVVVALAMRHRTRPLPCFTVSFEGVTGYDESAIAREMAEMAGAEWHPVMVGQQDLVSALPNAVRHGEGLAINGHIVGKYLLNKAIREAGCVVALTGEGADEVLAGYAHLREDLWLERHEAATYNSELIAGNPAIAGLMLAHGQTLPLDSLEKSLGFVPSFLKAKASLGFRLHSLFSRAFKEQEMDLDCFANLPRAFDVKGQMAGRAFIDQSLYLWTKLALAQYILRTLGDGQEMSASVEGRLPFLDHYFFEFVRDLPTDLKIRGKTEKYILREAFKDCITPTLYTRQKHPFLAPPLTRFSTGPLREMIGDIIAAPSFEAMGIFSQQKVLQLLMDLPQLDKTEQTAQEPVLMTILTAALLSREFSLGAAC